MILRYSLYGLFFSAIIAFSLLMGVVMQASDLMHTALVIGVGILWMIGAMLFGITLRSTLLMISTFFLRPSESTFYMLLALLAICLLAEQYKSANLKLVLPYPFAFFTLFAFGLYALTHTYVNGGSLYFSATIIVPFVAYVVISNIDFSEENLLSWSRVIVIVTVVLAIYGVIVAIRNPSERLGSTWSNAMTINGLYTMALFFAVGNAFKTKVNLMRLVWAGAAIVIFLGMIYTYTRIALVAVPFGLILLMFKVKKIRIYGIIALGLMPLIIPSSMSQRLATGITSDMSMIIRFVVWYNALVMIQHNLFTGIGFSTWKDIYLGIAPMPQFYAIHAHNVFINLTLEMGIFGFIAYFSIIVMTLRDYYKTVIKPGNDIFHYAVYVAALALIISCLTDIFIQQFMISILFWVTLALMHRKVRDVRAGAAVLSE